MSDLSSVSSIWKPDFSVPYLVSSEHLLNGQVSFQHLALPSQQCESLANLLAESNSLELVLECPENNFKGLKHKKKNITRVILCYTTQDYFKSLKIQWHYNILIIKNTFFVCLGIKKCIHPCNLIFIYLFYNTGNNFTLNESQSC